MDIIQVFINRLLAYNITSHSEWCSEDLWSHDTLCLMIMMSSTQMTSSNVTIWNKAVFVKHHQYTIVKRRITTIIIKYYLSSTAAVYLHECRINNTSINHILSGPFISLLLSARMFSIYDDAPRNFGKAMLLSCSIVWQFESIHG